MPTKSQERREAASEPKSKGPKLRSFYFPNANNGNGGSIKAETYEEALKVLEAQSTNSPSA